ncbi:hypothetical protein ABKV19_005012 [Rosa sericea]
MWKERRWAGTTFSRNLKNFSYDVHVVSPRNYFAFTSLLPSVACGTAEPWSIVEPIRNIVRKMTDSGLSNPSKCSANDADAVGKRTIFRRYRSIQDLPAYNLLYQ